MNRDQREEVQRRGEPRPAWLRLSPRLQQVAAFVPTGSRVADIGTDHGYVPIYLACTGQIREALAMDVGKGPLERAGAHIRAYERWAETEGLLPVSIHTRLSDGLTELRPGEADAVVMAGMGGELVMRILEGGRSLWDHIRTWILSPQSDLEKVRRYLAANGFCIAEEAMVRDEGKFYTVMKVQRDLEPACSAIQLRYGRHLLDRRDPILTEYLNRERKRVRTILGTLGGDTENQARARSSLELELQQIEEALYEIQGMDVQ